MVGLRNPIEIIERRLEEISDLVIKYGGQEKLEELRRKVQTIKTQSEVKTEFSEQEIGRGTIYVTTDKKDKVKSHIHNEELEIQQEGEVKKD